MNINVFFFVKARIIETEKTQNVNKDTFGIGQANYGLTLNKLQ